MKRVARPAIDEHGTENEVKRGTRPASSMVRLLLPILIVLFCLFCVAYPLAVIGVAFDVPSPFSLGAAGSALLFLEGTLVLLACALLYRWRRALAAGLLIIVLSYLVEAVGVNTGFPFGAYLYTDTLWPRLPGGVPLAVMFAWLLIVLGAYKWVRAIGSRLGRALLGAILGTLLDLAIEPVAAHVVHYWQWLAPGPLNYYGVPLANFVAWLIVIFLLLLLVEAIFLRDEKAYSKVNPHRTERLARSIPRILFAASLFMFGLVDLTHGYYGGTLFAALAGVVLSGIALHVVNNRN
ncbi:MAG TPA: carotenoid biosynthesis protein [Ktedonobacteraceae bacterium]|nr:carotenoid biosynthesis protein [Ktedonobacteraceae bacterium]